jgi:hypothetical protein
MIKEEVI